MALPIRFEELSEADQSSVVGFDALGQPYDATGCVLEPRRTSYVYFVRAPVNGLIKIGITVGHPDKRLASLRAGCPVDLEQVGVLVFPYQSLARESEQKLHALFLEHRRHAEWFAPGDSLVRYLEAAVEPWPEPGNDSPWPGTLNTARRRAVEARNILDRALRHALDPLHHP